MVNVEEKIWTTGDIRWRGERERMTDGVSGAALAWT
jgi:hypothetical protein